MTFVAHFRVLKCDLGLRRTRKYTNIRSLYPLSCRALMKISIGCTIGKRVGGMYSSGRTCETYKVAIEPVYIIGREDAEAFENRSGEER